MESNERTRSGPRAPARATHSGPLRGLLAVLLALQPATAPGLAEVETSPELSTLELIRLDPEALLGVQVTTVSRTPQDPFLTPSGLYVLSAADIRRSGATSIPEALRLVPGLEVARIDANKWAITIRGLNARTANKLLVLMDGRSLYTPFFTGVFWEAQDYPLEDIDRIEVVRGPGGTIWGSNAVHGVINIITRRAGETRGWLVTGGGGSEEQGFGTVRHGFAAGGSGHLRVYGKTQNRDDFVTEIGEESFDDWRMSQAGFRGDWTGEGGDQWTLQGDLYQARVTERSTVVTAFVPPTAASPVGDTDFSGGNVLMRWLHGETGAGQESLQLYYDRTERRNVLFDESRNTVDLDYFRHRPRSDGSSFTWGLGYRRTADHFVDTLTLTMIPADRSTDLVSAFAQLERGFLDDRLRLTLGTKLEINAYTDLEVQPTARATWRIGPDDMAWGAVSRSVRIPSRLERDSRLRVVTSLVAGMPPAVFVVAGNPGFDTEVVTTVEIGRRKRVNSRLELDLTLYLNIYRKLRTLQPGAPFVERVPGPAHLEIPFFYENHLDGRARGLEVAADWQVRDRWKLRLGYTFQEIGLTLDPSSRFPGQERVADDSPGHQAFVRSYLDLSRDLELNAMLRHVDALPNQRIPSYLSLDVNLVYAPDDDWRVALVGQNLLDDRHGEFGGGLRVQVEQGVYAKVTWTPGARR